MLQVKRIVLDEEDLLDYTGCRPGSVSLLLFPISGQRSIWTFPCKDIWMNMYIHPAARETAHRHLQQGSVPSDRMQGMVDIGTGWKKEMADEEE